MAISKKRLKDIEAIRDEDIDYSDIPKLDESFWPMPSSLSRTRANM